MCGYHGLPAVQAQPGAGDRRQLCHRGFTSSLNSDELFFVCPSGAARRPANRTDATAHRAVVPPLLGSHLSTSANPHPVQVSLSTVCNIVLHEAAARPTCVADRKQRQQWWRLAFPWKIPIQRIRSFRPMPCPGLLLGDHLVLNYLIIKR